MNKSYYSLGLMSGTSLDGVDASIILSDGEKKLEIIDNYYEKYDKSFQFKLKEFINKTISFEYINNNKALYKKLENQLTIKHEDSCILHYYHISLLLLRCSICRHPNRRHFLF